MRTSRKDEGRVGLGTECRTLGACRLIVVMEVPNGSQTVSLTLRCLRPSVRSRAARSRPPKHQMQSFYQSTTGESSEGSIIIISPRLKRRERDGVMRHGLIVFVAVSLKLAARNTAVTGTSPRRHALQLPAIPPSPRFPSGMNEPLACKKISCCAPRSFYVGNETRKC